MKLPLAILAATLLTGCAGSQYSLRIMEHDGNLRVDVSDDPSYDYRVYLNNVWDFGMDLDKEEDRLSTVSLLFKDTCRQTEVIEQVPINKGEYAGWGDRKAVTWVMKVRCLK